MKVAILTDTHCGVRKSSQRFIDYQNRFYSEIFFPYLKKHRIKNIWHGGDFFDDRVNVNYKALYSNRKTFLEPLVENKIHMTIINGNHDLHFKNSSKISSLKELLGYFTENVSIIMEPIDIQIGKHTFGFLPWINDENYEQSLEFIQKKSNADILLGHLELGGFEMYKGVQSYGGMSSELFKRFPLVLSGHYHTTSQRNNIRYLGSSFEFTWADENDPKFFHILDTNTLKIEAIRNPLQIYKKVRYNKNSVIPKNKDEFKDKFVRIIVEEKSSQYELDKYIDFVEASEPYDLTIIDSVSYGEFTSNDSLKIDQEDIKDIATDARNFIGKYIDGLETSLEKDILKRHMESIISEAEMLELS